MESISLKECPFCGEEIKSTAIKCKHCKEWLNVNCPYCGEQISSSAKICPECGSKLNLNKKNRILSVLSIVLTLLFVLIALSFITCISDPTDKTYANTTMDDKNSNLFCILFFLAFPLMPSLISFYSKNEKKISLICISVSLFFAVITMIRIFN